MNERSGVPVNFHPLLSHFVLGKTEGAKGLIRTRSRDVQNQSLRSKGHIINELESEIWSFDQRQKHGFVAILDGLQRIRGLAGSGKTVVLAMKAAQTHLLNPEAKILYTYYTRSLYQQIQRLITRFYRQFDDKDPDWEHLKIMHGWGGRGTEGVYYNTCKAHGIEPLSYRQVSGRVHPFDFVCQALLKSTEITSAYDYILVDEGQDFPASFLRLCIKLAKQNRVVFAYDDLQTIFQATTPTIQEIVGSDKEGNPLVELSEDIILYKCYRNPREIIVVGHAVGFGLYGSRIVQMLENREQWEDIGYEVLSGDFIEGARIIILRPEGNSLMTVSNRQTPNEIVQAAVHTTFDEEIQGVAGAIQSDISDGLRPEDILVVTVDDRHASAYLISLAEVLRSKGIATNNVHFQANTDREFVKEGQVTLSTVHKAKGNEAYMVYVMGVDALFSSYAGVRERNILFTAITRAKAWVRISGIGDGASSCKEEIDAALSNFPYLRFAFPSKEQLKILRRDLAAQALKKQEAERKLDEVMAQMSPEEIKRFIQQRSVKKGKRARN